MPDARKSRARDEAFARSGVLGGAATLGLDGMARLARYVAGSGYAAIHLLDGTDQHRVAAAGTLPRSRTPIEDSMCLPVVEADESIVLPDATQDPRYADNQHVRGPHPVRFFAANPLHDEAGVTIGTLCVFDYERIDLDGPRLLLLQDVAEQVSQHLELHSRVSQLGHSATHDALTGLPNRTLLSDRLAQAMAGRLRQPGEPAVGLIDLDGFKAINDEHGHQAGDELLIQISQRLEEAVRAEDTVARLSGDEFVVLFARLLSEHDFATICGRLTHALDQSFLVDGITIQASASMGFVRSEPDELGYSLLGRADAAMYQAKNARS